MNYHWPQYFSKRIWKVGATWAHSLASFFLSKYTFGWCPLATIICENLEKKKEKIHSQLQKKILILVVTNSWTWGFTWKRNCTLKHAHIDHWQPLEPPVASSFACSSHANRGQLGKNRWINMLPKMMEKIIVFSGLPVIFFAHERIKPFFVPIYPQHTTKIHSWNTYHICIKKWHLMNPPPLSVIVKNIQVSGTWTDSAFFTWKTQLPEGKLWQNCLPKKSCFRFLEESLGWMPLVAYPCFPFPHIPHLVMDSGQSLHKHLVHLLGRPVFQLRFDTKNFFFLRLHGSVKNVSSLQNDDYLFKTNTCSL